MRVTDGIRVLMQRNDPAPYLPDELSDRARYTLEDILVARPGAVSTRTGVGPTPRRSPFARGRRKRWIIAIAAFVTASTGVAVAVVLTDGVTPAKHDSVRCYTDTTWKNPKMHGVRLAPGDPGDASASAIERCTELWRRGMLIQQPPYTAPESGGSTDWPVPPLVACVVDDSAAVFPAEPDFCAKAGLPRVKVPKP